MERDHQTPAAAEISVLTQVNALPCAQEKAAVSDRDGYRFTQEPWYAGNKKRLPEPAG
jgi:hypothetical protein